MWRTFSNKRMAYKVLHSGYYWPSIFKDATKYVKGCDSCQRMGRPASSDQMPLQPQVMIEPFEKWALLSPKMTTIILGDRMGQIFLFL